MTMCIIYHVSIYIIEFLDLCGVIDMAQVSSLRDRLSMEEESRKAAEDRCAAKVDHGFLMWTNCTSFTE